MNKKKSYRILITPNSAASYDQRMVTGLAAGFNSIGHYAAAFSVPISSAELVSLCKNLSIDVVLQVNRTRDPDISLPSGVRFISWFQDVYPESLDGFAEKFQDSDILYSLGDPVVLGLYTKMPCFVSSLFTGVNQATLNFSHHNIQKDIDLSLCGGLPGAVKILPNEKIDFLWYIDDVISHIPLLRKSQLLWAIRKVVFGRWLPVDYVPYSLAHLMLQVVQSCYRPLRGELDIHMLANTMLQLLNVFCDTKNDSPPNANGRKMSRLSWYLKPYAHRYVGRSDFRARLIRYLARESRIFQDNFMSPQRKAISYFAQSYPRVMDRVALVEAAARVSKSLELYGPGLSSHEFTHPYLKGVIEDQDELLTIYCRSKINLNNNTHGLGLHSRTLECMAVGGFIFMHESPHDNKSGGMHTEFEPGVHYGSYTPENFHEEALRWLGDNCGRIRAGMQAKSIIRDRHCWHHRAQQIIDDLNR